MKKSTSLGVLAGTAAVLGIFALGAVLQPSGTAVAARRFQPFTLQPNAGSGWSGILDTQTGCVWAYASLEIPAEPKTPQDKLIAAIGAHDLSVVPYDPTDFAPLVSENGISGDQARLAALTAEEKACSEARIAALKRYSDTHAH